MKLGIKIWSTNINLIKLCKKHYAQNDFDYIEISAVRGTYNKDLLENIKGIPTVIHCDNFGVDLTNIS